MKSAGVSAGAVVCSSASSVFVLSISFAIVVSSVASGAFSFSLLDSSIAESSSSSLFDFLPLCFGIAINCSSSESSFVLSVVSVFSLNNVVWGASSSLVLFFFKSKFSPSFPLTVYTRSVSFLTILVRRRLGPRGFLLPSISACLSRIAYIRSWAPVSSLKSMPASRAMSCNSAMFLADNSSMLYMKIKKIYSEKITFQERNAYVFLLLFNNYATKVIIIIRN